MAGADLEERGRLVAKILELESAMPRSWLGSETGDGAFLEMPKKCG